VHVAELVKHYNTRRLHSAIGYITPADKLAGRESGIWAERDRRLEPARVSLDPCAEASRQSRSRMTCPYANQSTQPSRFH